MTLKTNEIRMQQERFYGIATDVVGMINLRWNPILPIYKICKPTYSCPLAREAFTGVGTKIGIIHDGFTITRTFTTWSETLKDAVKNVPYKQLWFPRARQVGCATFLATASRGTRFLTLRCRFDTFRNNMRPWNI
ncbi:hypothetical protein OSTOST_14853 [Ostertagia ostertagi]